jgi:DNA polymerase
LFDNAILSYRHRWVPCQMFDTMNMARALRGHMLSRMSLEHVASALGVGEKGKTILKMKGLHREDMIRQGIWLEAMAYAMQDNKLSKGIFKLLMPEFPRHEWRLMDLVLRCAIEPKFHCDRELLVKHILKCRKDKEDLLASTGVTKADLMSGPKFQAVLERYGVVVQYKVSPATGRQTPAFAKTDEFMADLQEHENPTVQALAAARLGLKSTLEETRAIRLLKIASLDWTPYCGSKLPLMPIPLRYGAAHTHRLAGDWSINMQNMTRGSPLRRALIAPPGHKVIVIDLAQIEARLVSWLAGATGLLEAFRTGDVYSFFATQVFGCSSPWVSSARRASWDWASRPASTSFTTWS